MRRVKAGLWPSVGLGLDAAALDLVEVPIMDLAPRRGGLAARLRRKEVSRSAWPHRALVDRLAFPCP